MNRIYKSVCTVLLLSLVNAPLLCAAQAASGLPIKHEPNFTSQGGNFSVWIPINVKPNDETRLSKCIGQARETHIFIARGDGAYWLVQYCALSDNELQNLPVREILDQARKEAIREAAGRLKKEKEITVGGYEGRHIIADSSLKNGGIKKPDGKYKARIYIVRDRVYRVATYVYKGNWGVHLGNMDAFVQSFTLIK